MARLKIMQILKSKRAQRKKKENFLLPGLQEDFASFVATDSDTNDESDSDSSTNGISFDTNENNATSETFLGFPPVKAKLLNNGYYDDGDPYFLCDNCGAYIRSSGSSGDLKHEIVGLLKKMLDSHNPHVKAFRSARERFNMEEGSKGLRLILPSERSTDARTHNLLTSKEVTTLIPGDFTAGVNKRDIVIESRSGNLQRISELHTAYLPLQYPLLFPYGEDGFRLGIDIGFMDTRGRKRKTVTMREFYVYRIFERYEESSTIDMAGKLFQQFLVDAFTTIESNRLNYIWINQSKLRTERVDKIIEAAEKGHEDLAQHGKRIFIPSSFTGGKRYMMQHYLDAMATCKYFGFSDLFITFTCNPRWPEIDRFLARHRLSKEDRHDICSRVFKMKLDRLMDQVRKEKTFGIVNSDNKMRTSDDIDKYISAEIPDKEVDKYLYEVVSDVMIHGPCDHMNRDSVCMNNGQCTKFFPKPFMDNTVVDDAGYPIYRRRNDVRIVEKRGFQYDNSYVIPYNRDLSLRFRAHINVEWCNQTRSVKYLSKYITKGPDYVRAEVGEEDQENEIKKFFNCR
ncbi:PREDICTED: uncharacterized protein LOC104714922 [Camelina sativa]|uniref:Uncharacterized protein LOC104714922 n=1 Tax=Camelina sativa TaxID=90675 RepID=A0ABM0TSP9_CAMSA|nr:PREDICTED: uncharacterized protein LOC104714922 [Camelina sativa]